MKEKVLFDDTDAIENYMTDSDKIRLINLGIPIKNNPAGYECTSSEYSDLVDDILYSVSDEEEVLHGLNSSISIYEDFFTDECTNSKEEDSCSSIVPYVNSTNSSRFNSSLVPYVNSAFVTCFSPTLPLYSLKENEPENLQQVCSKTEKFSKYLYNPNITNESFKVNRFSVDFKKPIKISQSSPKIKESNFVSYIKADENKEIFKKAEDIANEKISDLVSNPQTIKRFVLDKPVETIFIDECLQMDDLKGANLIGKIRKRGRNGKYQNNYFKIVKNKFICYNGKKIKKENEIEESTNELILPEDSNFYLSLKYELDIKKLKIYLVINPHLKRFLLKLRSLCIKDEKNLFDITHKVIENVIETPKNFRVIVSSSNVADNVYFDTSVLEFALQSGDAFYFYRPNSTSSFLRWAYALKSRISK